MSDAPTNIIIRAECGCRFRVVSGNRLNRMSACDEHRGEPEP